jgi:hypothetical protein
VRKAILLAACLCAALAIEFGGCNGGGMMADAGLDGGGPDSGGPNDGGGDAGQDGGLCAGVVCDGGSLYQCCPSTGMCYNIACGSCCFP